MRQPKVNRAARRGQPIDAIIRANQTRHIQAFCTADAKETARGVDHIGRMRTLKYDEQSKAKLTVIERDNGLTVQQRSNSCAALVVEAAPLNEWTSVEERVSTHVVPRQALTDKLYLRLFKPVMQFEDRAFKVLDDASKAQLTKIHELVSRAHPDNRIAFAAALMRGFVPTFIAGTNPSLVWKSDQTLLNRSSPDSLKTVAVKRVSNYTKETAFEQESDELPTWDASTPRTWDDEHPTSNTSVDTLDSTPDA